MANSSRVQSCVYLSGISGGGRWRRRRWQKWKTRCWVGAGAGGGGVVATDIAAETQLS